MDGESLRDILARPAPEAVLGFMRRWHGADGRGEPAQTHRLPAVLGSFHASYAPAATTSLVNQLLSPDQIEDDEGFSVFYVEEQAVFEWAIATTDLGLDDPPVWGRERRGEAHRGRPPPASAV